MGPEDGIKVAEDYLIALSGKDFNDSFSDFHMGWNDLTIPSRTGLFAGITGNPYVYFVHSYYLTADDPAIVSSRTSYGVSIDASVQKGNIFATQFHPEKSGSAGLDMLRNFAAITRGEAR